MAKTPRTTQKKQISKKLPKKRKIAAHSTPKKPLLVFGVGSSAGGLEPLIQILSSLPPRLNAASVIIQHLDPTHKSLLTEILARSCKLPVLEIEDSTPIQAGVIYVLPPQFDVVFKQNQLRLTPRTREQGLPHPIDRFLQSLGNNQNYLGAGIILSGNGSDGVIGARDLRKNGGVVLVQSPSTAKHPSMPQSVITANEADFVLGPKQIQKKMLELIKNPHLIQTMNAKKLPKQLPQNSELVPEFLFSLLRRQFQVDFSHYKPTTLKRRIERRMALQKKNSLVEYSQYLEETPQEATALFDDLLIKVTEFFRDPKTFRALQKKVLQKIVNSKLPGSPIRIWVAGCATGEEAYSVAISLIEVLEESGKKNPVQLFATDISDTAIQKARTGVYPDSIQKNISEERLNRFFTRTEKGYKIKSEIRECCLFSRHDITVDPPFVRLDLVCCRNLLIYFDSTLQKRVLPILLYSLNPGGFLWLGRSESVGRLSSFFQTADKTHRFYFRDKDQAIPRLDFPTRTFWSDKPELKPQQRLNLAQNKPELQSDTEELLLAEYAPPGVAINSRSEIILARGDTSLYLQLPRGAVSLNLFKMARPELIPELRIAVQTARRKNTPVKKKAILLHDGSIKKYITLSVFPLPSKAKTNKQDLLILFEHTLEPESLDVRKRVGEKTPGIIALLKNRKIQGLEEELAEAKLYQQSLIEDFEATQEEITSTNEELQSANEELQSTIEELETAKEELQSSNEELVTVNEELRNRNGDLIQLNNDLVNLLGSVDLPIVMLGADGRIRRFTPKASHYFNLISGDIGRSIGDVKPNFEGPELKKLISDVTESMTLQEHEVKSKEGRWFRLQIRPYKTTDHRIEGAVISLIDINLLKQSLIESQTALRYAASVTDTFPLPLVVLDESFRILFTNQEFRKTFDFDPQTELGSDFMFAIDGQVSSLDQLSDRLKEVLSAGKPLLNYEVTHNFRNKGERTVIFSAQQILWQDHLPRAILVSMENITARRNLEKDLQSSQERFRILIESAHDAILIISEGGKIEFANKQAQHWFGYEPNELMNKDYETLIPHRFRNNYIHHRTLYFQDPVPRTMNDRKNLWVMRKDGSEFPVEISLSPIHFRNEVHVAAIIRDVTETRRMAEERMRLFEQEKRAHADAEIARTEAVRANEAKDVFLAILSHELRTPLTSILVWAQLLKRGQNEAEKLRRGLDTIETCAQVQGQLINDLLDVSRIQSGKLSLTINSIDPHQLARSAIESVRQIALSRKINIELIDQLSSEKIQGDHGRLQQILWNLLTNAIKFSEDSGKIEVVISKAEDSTAEDSGRPYVTLQVTDHGRGIDPKFLPHLFTRFTQQDSTTTRLHGGLGIGLALVQDLAKAHGGYVTAESAGVGTGARFTVFLPMMYHSQELPYLIKPASEATEQTSPDLTGLKILIIDDEPSSLEAFVEIVKAFRGQPIPCSSAKEAWTVLQSEVPDVLVSDIAMPIEDGYSLIQRIRKLNPNQGGAIPAIALTAFAANHDIERALAAGFQDHLAKPVNSTELGRIILKVAHIKR
jgi:two-component system CheB/CheR fusion protein